MPSEQTALGQQEKAIEDVAEKRERENSRIHLRHLKRPLGEQDELAQPIIRNDHLSQNSED